MSIKLGVRNYDDPLCQTTCYYKNAEHDFIRTQNLVNCLPCLSPALLDGPTTPCIGVSPPQGNPPSSRAWNYHVEITGGAPYPGDMIRDGNSSWNLPFIGYPSVTPDTAGTYPSWLYDAPFVGSRPSGRIAVFCQDSPCAWTVLILRYSFTGSGGGQFYCVWEARPEAVFNDLSLCPNKMSQGIALPMYTASKFTNILTLGVPIAYPAGAGWPVDFDNCNSIGTGTGDSQFGVRVTWDYLHP